MRNLYDFKRTFMEITQEVCTQQLHDQLITQFSQADNLLKLTDDAR